MERVTKQDIENMAKEIYDMFLSYDIDDVATIFFNNKSVSLGKDYIENENVNPFDYFEYANPHHILSMSFDGSVYEIFNYSGGIVLESFDKILEKYNVYYELGNAWNLTVYPLHDNVKFETTEYSKKKCSVVITENNLWMYPEIEKIVRVWQEYQNKIGDVGSCVLGAGFSFMYNGDELFLTPCSMYQGSISWEANVSEIKEMLDNIGCTNVQFNYGLMD